MERVVPTDVLAIVAGSMARIKNICRQKLVKDTDTYLPRAKFSTKMKTRACEVCGKAVSSTNLARHMKTQHRRGSGGVAIGDEVREVIRTSSPKVPKMKIRLPSFVTARLGRRSLPPTPESEEELNHELAKLYAGRVSKKDNHSMGYDYTRTLLTLAKDPSNHDELKEVLSQAGLILHTKEEFSNLLSEAEAKGTKQTQAATSEVIPVAEESGVFPDAEGDAVVPAEMPVQEVELGVLGDVPEMCDNSNSVTETVPEARESVVGAELPPLCVTSKYSTSGQTVTIHLGGKFGITVTPCLL